MLRKIVLIYLYECKEYFIFTEDQRTRETQGYELHAAVITFLI